VTQPNQKILQAKVVAIDASVKQDVFRGLLALRAAFQKTPLLNGISRTYQPLDDESGDKLPPESTLVQLKVKDALEEAQRLFIQLFDTTATKEYGNQLARADLIVDGRTLIENAPAILLVFLDKQLHEMMELLKEVPTLDPSDKWELDENDKLYKTVPVETARMKKLPRAFEKAKATDKFQAQVETYFEDEVVGYWTTVRMSGALPAEQVREMMRRVRKLQIAVKQAQQQANTREVDNKDGVVGKVVLDYIFA
jgi:hypothetical protein